jgi:hypothetical protein
LFANILDIVGVIAAEFFDEDQANCNQNRRADAHQRQRLPRDLDRVVGARRTNSATGVNPA